MLCYERYAMPWRYNSELTSLAAATAATCASASECGCGLQLLVTVASRASGALFFRRLPPEPASSDSRPRLITGPKCCCSSSTPAASTAMAPRCREARDALRAAPARALWRSLTSAGEHLRDGGAVASVSSARVEGVQDDSRQGSEHSGRGGSAPTALRRAASSKSVP